MTTINNYSVSLSLEAGDYIRNSSLSRTETGRLRREIDAARTPLENYQLAMRRLEVALQEGAIDERLFNRLLEEQWQKLQKVQSATRQQTEYTVRYTSEVNRLNGAFAKHNRQLGSGTGTISSGGSGTGLIGGTFKLAAAYLSVHHALRLVGDGFRVFGERESAEVTLKVLTRSAETARHLVQQVKLFAKDTPYAFNEVLTGVQAFIAFGGSADDAIGKLRMFGDIAAATGTNLGELIREVSKMRSQMNIMSQDLNQLTQRGINILPGLAKKLNVEIGEVKEMASKRLITFQMLDEVLQDLADNQFFGMMDARSQTLLGKWEKFNDELADTKAYIAEIVMGVNELTGVASGGTSGLQNFNNNMREILGHGRRERAQAKADAELAASSTAYQLALRRKGKGGISGAEVDAITNMVRERQNKQFWLNSRYWAQSKLHAKFDGSAGMAAAALGAGLMQMGQSLANSFQLSTERIVQSQEQVLAPSFEVGTQEAYKAALESQNNAIRAERGTLEKKQDKQVGLLDAIKGTTTKQTSYIEEMLAIWRDSGPFKKAR